VAAEAVVVIIVGQVAQVAQAELILYPEHQLHMPVEVAELLMDLEMVLVEPEAAPQENKMLLQIPVQMV
jgi:hypothetical protein